MGILFHPGQEFYQVRIGTVHGKSAKGISKAVFEVLNYKIWSGWEEIGNIWNTESRW